MLFRVVKKISFSIFSPILTIGLMAAVVGFSGCSGSKKKGDDNKTESTKTTKKEDQPQTAVDEIPSTKMIVAQFELDATEIEVDHTVTMKLRPSSSLRFCRGQPKKAEEVATGCNEANVQKVGSMEILAADGDEEKKLGELQSSSTGKELKLAADNAEVTLKMPSLKIAKGGSKLPEAISAKTTGLHLTPLFYASAQESVELDIAVGQKVEVKVDPSLISSNSSTRVALLLGEKELPLTSANAGDANMTVSVPKEMVAKKYEARIKTTVVELNEDAALGTMSIVTSYSPKFSVTLVKEDGPTTVGATLDQTSPSGGVLSAAKTVDISLVFMGDVIVTFDPETYQEIVRAYISLVTGNITYKNVSSQKIDLAGNSKVLEVLSGSTSLGSFEGEALVPTAEAVLVGASTPKVGLKSSAPGLPADLVQLIDANKMSTAFVMLKNAPETLKKSDPAGLDFNVIGDAAERGALTMMFQEAENGEVVATVPLGVVEAKLIFDMSSPEWAKLVLGKEYAARVFSTQKGGGLNSDGLRVDLTYSRYYGGDPYMVTFN